MVENINFVQDIVLKDKNLHQVMFNISDFQLYFGSKKTVELFEDKILEIENPYLSYWFVTQFKEADIKAHEQIVLKKGTAKINYLFTRDVEGADVKAHEKVILEEGTAQDNYLFARDIEGADVKAHGQVVLDRDAKSEYYFLFAYEGIC